MVKAGEAARKTGADKIKSLAHIKPRGEYAGMKIFESDLVPKDEVWVGDKSIIQKKLILIAIES